MLTPSQVQEVIDAATSRGEALGAPISVAVVDEGGYIQGVFRTERAFRVSPDIAISKAYTSAIFGRPTLDIGNETPAEVLAARRNIGLYPMSGSGGGIPVWKAGVVVAAIGVGGALPDADIECAMAGLSALGYEYSVSGLPV